MTSLTASTSMSSHGCEGDNQVPTQNSICQARPCYLYC
jgi:hypothetical protein